MATSASPASVSTRCSSSTPLRGHYHLLGVLGSGGQAGFAQRETMPVGCHSTEQLPIDFQQHAIQVVANILLRHGEMGFLQQPQQFLARQLHALL